MSSFTKYSFGLNQYKRSMEQICSKRSDGRKSDRWTDSESARKTSSTNAEA